MARKPWKMADCLWPEEVDPLGSRGQTAGPGNYGRERGGGFGTLTSLLTHLSSCGLHQRRDATGDLGIRSEFALVFFLGEITVGSFQPWKGGPRFA